MLQENIWHRNSMTKFLRHFNQAQEYFKGTL